MNAKQEFHNTATNGGFLQFVAHLCYVYRTLRGTLMGQPIRDTVLKFRANAELAELIRRVARSQHKTPSEYMRHVLASQTREDA